MSDGCFPSTGGGVRKRWLWWSQWWRWRSTESRRYTLALPSKCHSVAKEQHVDCTGHKTPDIKTRVSNAYLWRSSIVRHHQLGIYFQAGRTLSLKLKSMMSYSTWYTSNRLLNMSLIVFLTIQMFLKLTILTFELHQFDFQHNTLTIYYQGRGIMIVLNEHKFLHVQVRHWHLMKRFIYWQLLGVVKIIKGSYEKTCPERMTKRIRCQLWTCDLEMI